MLPQNRTGSSARRNRTRRKMPIWLLALLVVAMGGLVIAGPALYAQGTRRQPATPRTATPAPTPATPEAAPAPMPAPVDVAPAPTPAPEAPKAEEKAAEAGGEAIKLPFGPSAWIPLIIVLISAFIALFFGVYWWKKTMAVDPGSERMRGVAAAIQDGAMAYLSRQVKTMIPLVLVIMVGLFILYKYQYADQPGNLSWVLAAGVAVAFMLGVAASYAAGYVGMGVAVRGNVRVANAALSSFKKALETAFQAGAVSGMFTVGLGLLGATITFMVFQENAMFVLVGFGFGGSLAALFMRVGGGIFTKAADVGADLVGKVEANIPEDDPRNAATIADNVGDNVGDCAGMAADVFESYEVTLVAAIILAAAVGMMMQNAGFGPMIAEAGVYSFTAEFTLGLVIFALLVRAVGVFASIIGIFAVKGKDDANLNPMVPINTGLFVSSAIATVGFLIVAYFVFFFNMSAPTLAGKFVTQPIYNFSNAKFVPAGELAVKMKEGLGMYAMFMSPEKIRDMQSEGMTEAAEGLAEFKKLEPSYPMTMEGINKFFADSNKKGASPDSPSMKAIQKVGSGLLGKAGVPQDPAVINKALELLNDNSVLKAKIGQWFWLYAFVATFIGIILTQIIGKLTEYFTAEDKKPVTEIAMSARTGPATLILSGLSEGLESSVWSVVAIAGTITAVYFIFPNPALVAYAIALVGLGLLATTGYVLAMDTYGPISDNANGIFEMSGALKNDDGTENKAAHNIVARLDMVGNTTKALTKGFAIATAVIAAVALYRSFIDTAAVQDPSILVKNIQVNLPEVFVGLLIGGAVPFLFSSFAIRAVSRAAVLLVEEVRRQFREIPGIWEYTGVGEVGKPEYHKCVSIATAAAQKELLGPGLLAVFAPMLVGFSLGAYALGGFLAGAILAGQLMAVFMSNAGGAWDNAKKKIEDGFLGGKGSEAHKAGVIGDTVGDPLKDTAGPALNPMIKVMNLVAILVAPATVILTREGQTFSIGSFTGPMLAIRIVVIVLVLAILIFAIWWSKRGGVTMAASEGEGNGQAPAKPETPAEV